MINGQGTKVMLASTFKRGGVKVVSIGSVNGRGQKRSSICFNWSKVNRQYCNQQAQPPIYITYAQCLMSKKGLIWSEYMADSHFYALVINHQVPYITTMWCLLIMSYTGVRYTVTQRNTQRCLQPEAKKLQSKLLGGTQTLYPLNLSFIPYDKLSITSTYNHHF